VKLAVLVALVVGLVLVSANARAVSNAMAIEWLSTELLKLPRSLAPGETREEYTARVYKVATALVEESRGFADGKGWSLTELAAAAGVIWQGETLFDRRVQSGEGHPIWHQDHGLARCGMQLHRSGIVPQEVWERLVGEHKDALHLCAQYGLRVVVAQARQCGVYYSQRADRTRVAKMLASYASGGKCVPTDDAWKRADRWVKIMASRPDRAPLRGYRRIPDGAVPAPMRERAEDVAWQLTKGAVRVGYLLKEEHAGRSYVLLVEHHARGKVGVSVLVQE
jgi:hypothetical protein